MDGEDFYSVEQAADTLELTPGRVRQMLRAGDLEGIPPGERRGEAEPGGRGWRVSRESVEALLRRRPPRPEPTETPETDARADLVGIDLTLLDPNPTPGVDLDQVAVRRSMVEAEVNTYESEHQRAA